MASLACGKIDRASAKTFSISGPQTMTVSEGGKSLAACSTWLSRLLPAARCRTLGRLDFMRVPWPAASTITAISIIKDVPIVESPGITSIFHTRGQYCEASA